MANKLGCAKFRGGWDHGENATFVVTLQITNLPTKEDRDLILHKVGNMMHRLLIEAQEAQEEARDKPGQFDLAAHRLSRPAGVLRLI